jgi:glycosyltransferase involved in cell wall biosynthesis
VVLVGGDPPQVAHAKQEIERLGLSGHVLLTGQRPAEEIPAYLDAATVLVSPRSTGTNTPLKIYQYLRSGRPIVATNLRTHTQVLSDDIALLADPTPEAFGAAIVDAFADPERAAAIGARAKTIANTRYSDEAYLAKTRQACGLLFAEQQGAPERGLA